MASPRHLINLSSSSQDARRAATVYIKGFLARDESRSDFAPWLAAHERLATSPHAWGERAHAFSWQRGNLYNLPLPLLTAARIGHAAARGGHRLLGAGAIVPLVAGDLGVHAARLLKQFYDAKSSARDDGERLAESLRDLRGECETVRVVAHSLGCLATVEAIALLPLDERPDEVHLCAAALPVQRLLAADVRDGLARPGASASNGTAVYFCRDDVVLASAFRFAEMGALAVGQCGFADLASSSEAPPPRTVAFDVGVRLARARAQQRAAEGGATGRFERVRSAIQRTSDAFRSHSRYAAAFDRIAYGDANAVFEEAARTQRGALDARLHREIP